MIQIALVGVGGAVGAIARYLSGVGFAKFLPNTPTWAPTLFVNILGGLFMGLLVGVLALKVSEGGERLRLLLAVGVLGGFTTFSTFSLDVVTLLRRHDELSLIGYVVGSVLLSVAALMLGLMIARKVFA
jgi:CrcB protein